MSVSTGGRTVAVAAPGRAPRKRWPAHWPLSVLVLGYPVWWLLGVASFIPLLLAIPMAAQLLRQRRIYIPRGLGWWLIFLLWMAIGVFTLYADAPGAVPGGGASRLVVFAYRAAWYLACTVVLLWVVNTRTRDLSTRRVTQLFGYMFVITVLGGLLGVVSPQLDFPSLLEMALPGSIADNAFVNSLIHPGIADVQTVLGHPEARPTAPFAYANSWGANLSMFVPFFVVAWFRGGHRWQRPVGAGLLLLAAVPTVYSLNRGLWAALGLGIALVIMRQVLKGRLAAIVATAVVLMIAAIVFVGSPLGDLVSQRMDHQHSNERRGQLLVETVESTAKGSPVVGFGSTRDVQGSFASIAGASTPDCSACGVPPLGTQGQLWLLIFSQGFGGALLFLAFFASVMARTWRCRTSAETICTCLLLFSALEMFIYSSVELPLFTVMVAIGLVYREQAGGQHGRRPLGRNSDQLLGGVARSAWLVVLLMCLGATAGLVLSASRPQTYTAQASVLLAPSPTYLVSDDALEAGKGPKDITIDTEAALVLSSRTLDEVEATVGRARSKNLRARVQLSAVPNTRVLNLVVRSTRPGDATATVDALADAYLHNRHRYLRDRRTQVMQRLRVRLTRLGDPGAQADANQTVFPDEAVAPGGDGPSTGEGQEQAVVRQAINDVVLTPTSAGEVVRRNAATPEHKRYAVNVASGAAAGMALGVLIALAAPLPALRELALRHRRRAWRPS